MTFLVNGLYNIVEGEVFFGEYSFKCGSKNVEDGYYMGMVEVAKDEIIYVRGGFRISDATEDNSQALFATMVGKINKIEDVNRKDGGTFKKATFGVYRGSLESMVYSSCPVSDGIAQYLEKGSRVMVTGQMQLSERKETEVVEGSDRVKLTFPYYVNLYKAKLSLLPGVGGNNTDSTPKPANVTSLVGFKPQVTTRATPVVDPVEMLDTDSCTF